MITVRILLISAVTLVTLFSCTAAQPQPLETPRANIVATVKSPETTLVDVRVAEEFAESPVKNAVNIPLAEIENNLDFFRNQKQIVVFCNLGKQADQAEAILKKNGISNVHNGKTYKNVAAIQQLKTATEE